MEPPDPTPPTSCDGPTMPRFSTTLRFAWIAVSASLLNAPGASAEDRAPGPPPGRVRVEIGEAGIPEKPEWPGSPVAATESYAIDAFGISRIPHRYVATGVRGDRANPFLLRASSAVELPPGTHRLLLRGRGAARLFVDGRLILETPFPPPMTDGHTPIPTDYLDLGPDFRFAPPGNREDWTIFESPGCEHLFTVETIIGGLRGKAPLRPEPGETVVAIAPEGSETFRLLAPGRAVQYTDEGWRAYAEEEATAVARIEAERRAAAFRPFAAGWAERRERAERWLATTPEPVIPALPAGFPSNNAIDHFLAAKLAESERSAGPEGSIDFEGQVRPLLEARCYSCHQGRKVKGGLRLDTAEGARAGGASELPAIVPGEPGESELIFRVESPDELDRMPPDGDRLTAEEIGLLRRWIAEGAGRSSGHRDLTPTADDLAFLRRVTLDTVGLVPTEAEVRAFLGDDRPDRRARVIDRLLADPRGADHWVGYWQDVLAENPNILNPTLNNTGPFRWWIYESLLDKKPVDRFVTELIGMEGSLRQGGPAGFAMASENDVPMAEKGMIVAGGVPRRADEVRPLPRRPEPRVEAGRIVPARRLPQGRADQGPGHQQRAARQAARPGPGPPDPGDAPARNDGRAGLAVRRVP